MTVNQKDKIDFIGVDKKSGTCILTISDHLDWKHSSEHLLNLQSKINAYLEFIDSGQFLTDFPDSKGRNIRIEITGQHAIPESISNEYKPKISVELDKFNVEFNWIIIND